MKIVSLCKAVFGALALMAGVTPAGAAAPLMKGGTWIVPTADEVAAAWPSAARRDGIKGYVIIECGVNRAGRVGDCTSVVEPVAGYGIGTAIASLYETGARVDPASVPGGIRPGVQKRFIVHFGM